MRPPTILALLPALAAAVDFQITSWLCTPLLEPNEGQDHKSVRHYGETGCSGWTLREQDDGSWAGTYSGEEPLEKFKFSEDPEPVFEATVSGSTRPGTCVAARGADVCQTFSAACAISLQWDCTYDPEPEPQPTARVMVVGDSISHGMEGDWTWRWRLFAWMQDILGYRVLFVGPWAGTHGVTSVRAALPQPPLFPGESPRQVPENLGLYDSRVPSFFAVQWHAAWWGRQAAQTKDTIRDWVAEHQPEYLLILLGFNDLGWWVSGPDGLIGNMGQLVENARLAKPDVKILVGNVVHRTFIGGRQDLVDNTNRYNQMLRERISNWFRWESPIAYVDVQANYDCHPQGCPDAYDGLHPNAMGEYHIAQAFARTLKADFGFEGPDFVVPANPEHRDIRVPTGVVANSHPYGLCTYWDRDPVARGYDIRSRLQGMSGWWSEGQVYPDTAGSCTTWLVNGQTWEFQVRTRGDNDERSGWSGITSATADLQTSEGPQDITVVPQGDGIRVSWSLVSGYDVNRYGIIIWDQDTEGSFIQEFPVGASVASHFIGGLNMGHRYGVWVTTYVNIKGPFATDVPVAGGLPRGGREVIVGSVWPMPPPNLRVTNTDPTTVQLNWDRSETVSGYAIYVRSIRDNTAFTLDGTTTDTTYGVGLLFPGTWNFQFCVAAYNGNLESAHNCVIPPVYPGFEKRDVVTNSTDVAEASAEDRSAAMAEDETLRMLYQLYTQRAADNSTLF